MSTDPSTIFTTDDLVLATSPTRTGDGSFALRVPQGWGQGRGAFGGLVLASLTRAVEACEEDRERALRSLTAEITGPVLVGDATIEVKPLRRGSGVSTWSAELTQAGEVLAHATLVLGRTRVRDRDWTPPPPEHARAFHDVPDAHVGPPSGPEFVRLFELRSEGPLPFTGSHEAVASGWVRPRKAVPVLGAPEIVAYADAWWPVGLALEREPRPASTIAFTLQMFPPRAPLDPASPLYYRARIAAARDGFVVEFRELWTAAGELVALNQQTFVWIR